MATFPPENPPTLFQTDLFALTSGPLHRFSEWPSMAVPKEGSAVYTIWNEELGFIYADMSGRSEGASGRGPWGRLNSHVSGRRSGDQFCIYVCDRLVLPGLHNRLHDVADGTLSLDPETRRFIRERFAFRVRVVASPDEARRVELALRRGESMAGAPLLNPGAPTTKPLRTSSLANVPGGSYGPSAPSAAPVHETSPAMRGKKGSRSRLPIPERKRKAP